MVLANRQCAIPVSGATLIWRGVHHIHSFLLVCLSTKAKSIDMETEITGNSVPLLQSTSPSVKPIEISFPLPRTPHTNVHIHLTAMATSTMVFLSTTNAGDAGSSVKPMGSFVYSMPDVGCSAFYYAVGMVGPVLDLGYFESISNEEDFNLHISLYTHLVYIRG